ncbi:hypothetical protein [Halioxenophilus aromaticivorans]|uniref:Uncharacterized protein n=1 Tax=Halioxenophilus aromaticivorans TaxID=1306992 RepID=A0AAV3U585_9ALTE
MCVLLVAAILFVVFGQITVRKLRKNPDTKNKLGVEFASGWDILNVAQALALPKKITRVLAKSPISGFYADRVILEQNTSPFDRGLAKVFWYLYVFSVVSMLLLMLLNTVGFFD